MVHFFKCSHTAHFWRDIFLLIFSVFSKTDRTEGISGPVFWILITETQKADEAACETTAHPVQEWDELCCTILVSGLVNQILKNLSIHFSADAFKTTIVTIKEMLWEEIADSDIALEPSGHHIKKEQ